MNKFLWALIFVRQSKGDLEFSSWKIYLIWRLCVYLSVHSISRRVGVCFDFFQTSLAIDGFALSVRLSVMTF